MKHILKKKNIIERYYKVVVFFAVLLCVEGCASITPVKLSAHQSMKTISMTSNINKEYTIIRHFKVKQKSRMSPYGASADFNELITPDLISSQADAIVNVSIKGDAAIPDVFFPIGLGLLGGLTLSPMFYFLIPVPLFEDLKTYEVEGDLVKYIDQTSAPVMTKELIDPLTGLPQQKQKIKYDAETGLPVKE
jgi:hypothetical protein